MYLKNSKQARNVRQKVIEANKSQMAQSKYSEAKSRVMDAYNKAE